MTQAQTRRTAFSVATRISATISICLLASNAWASGSEDDEQIHRELTRYASEVELGFLYSSEDSFFFGDYTGLEDQGFSVLGNVDIRRRYPLDGDGTPQYFRLQGLNLGLDSRYIGAEYEQQGRFRVFFEFDEIPKFRTDSAATPYLHTGSTHLTLPPGWTPGDGPADMPDLLPNLVRLEVDHKRRRYGAGASLVLPKNLVFETRYDHQTKKGNKLAQGVIGTSGGNARSIIIPEQIEYTTDQVQSSLRYANENLQLAVGYYLSLFDNAHNNVTWENPYLAEVDWDPSAGYPVPVLPECIGVSGCGTGRTGQAPDNWSQQITASGGYNLPLNTRATLNAAFGWMNQNDDFLAYSVNEALTVGTPLPHSSLDGKIRTTLVDFRVTSRPMPKVRSTFQYRYDNRDNDTPTDIYVRIRGDAEDQDPAGIDSEEARRNRPYSLERHQVKFDTGYEFAKRTGLTLGYEFERTDRNLQEVGKLDEHSLVAKLQSRPSSFVSLGANYSHSWRDGSHYNGVKSLLATLGPAQLATFDPDTDWENHPLLRKYYLADRERDDVHTFATFLPTESLSIGLNVRWSHDDYDDTQVGLTNQWVWSPGVDIQFVPTERMSLHAFYTFERVKRLEDGWSFQGFAKIPQSQDPGRRWSQKDKDLIHTVGAGLKFGVLPKVFDVGVEYLYSRSRDKIGVAVGDTLEDPDLLPFPDAKADLMDVSVYGDLQITTNVGLRLGYLFEKFTSTDWMLDAMNPASLAPSCGDQCVIGTGQNSPDYKAHVVAFSVIYKFW